MAQFQQSHGVILAAGGDQELLISLAKTQVKLESGNGSSGAEVIGHSQDAAPFIVCKLPCADLATFLTYKQRVPVLNEGREEASGGRGCNLVLREITVKKLIRANSVPYFNAVLLFTTCGSEKFVVVTESDTPDDPLMCILKLAQQRKVKSLIP